MFHAFKMRVIKKHLQVYLSKTRENSTLFVTRERKSEESLVEFGWKATACGIFILSFRHLLSLASEKKNRKRKK